MENELKGALYQGDNFSVAALVGLKLEQLIFSFPIITFNLKHRLIIFYNNLTKIKQKIWDFYLIY